MHQRHGARREDVRRHRDQVPPRPGGRRSRRASCAAVDIVLPEGTIVSAMPPDGAVFLYCEQNQAMLSALLRALAQALGPAAMAGDRGGTDIHIAFGAQPDGTPWVSVAQCGGEIGPFGANAHGDADSQMLSYLANGIAVAGGGGRGRRAGRDPPARDRSRHGRARLPPRRRVGRARLALADARAALADDAARQAGRRLRRQRRWGRQNRRRLGLRACQPTAPRRSRRSARIRTATRRRSPASSTRRRTPRPERTLRLPVRAADSPDACALGPALPQPRRRRLGRPAGARARAGQARRPRRLRHDRGRRAGLRGRRRRRPGA